MERQRGHLLQPETTRGFSMAFANEAKRVNSPVGAQRLRAEDTIIFMSERERNEVRKGIDTIREAYLKD